MRPILLSAIGVSVYYGSKKVVYDVSLDMRSGEVFALLGPNGSGKSTMVKAFVRLADKEGDIRILNLPMESFTRKTLARAAAYMPQKVQVVMPFKVMDVVLLGRYPWISFLGDYSDKDLNLARRSLDEVGMTGFEDRIITTLSGGEVQRVMIAQCLTQDAAIMLLDEPTSALDPKYSIAVMSILRNYVKNGRAALCVMHDVNLALRFADRVALMKEGSIRYICGSSEVDASMLSDVFDVPWHIEEWQGGRIALPL